MSRVNHYANIEGIPGLAEAIYLAGREYRGGITALAIDMGMDYNRLQAKLNPSKPDSLSPEELTKFLELACTNDILLALSAAGAGVGCFPLPMGTAGDRYRALSKISQSRSNLEALLAEAHDAGDEWPQIVGTRLERALLEHAQVVLGISEGAIRHLGEQESDPVEA